MFSLVSRASRSVIPSMRQGARGECSSKANFPSVQTRALVLIFFLHPFTALYIYSTAFAVKSPSEQGSIPDIEGLAGRAVSFIRL